jgi:hypothetical protein
MSATDAPRRLTVHPDPLLARLERLYFPNGLTLEDRIRLGVRAAKLEMDPRHLEILRRLSPGTRLRQAFALWRMARGALYSQGVRRGLTPEAAMREAARRLLADHNDV